MKKLESSDPERQRIYESKGKTYSVVNLMMFHKGADGKRLLPDWTFDHYKSAPFELADITDERVVVIERFATVKEASDEIRKLNNDYET